MALSDILGIVGILLTVITVIVAVYYGWRQTRRKSIEWRMTAYGSWLKIEDGIREKLQVTYDGHLVENLQFVVLRLVNNGGIEVKETDFHTPLQLSFGEQAKIFEVQISDKHPSDLPVKYTVDDQQIIFENTLINPRDTYTLQIIGTNLPEMPEVTGRIAGVSEISFRDERNSTFSAMLETVNSPIGKIALSVLPLGIGGLIFEITDTLRKDDTKRE